MAFVAHHVLWLLLSFLLGLPNALQGGHAGSSHHHSQRSGVANVHHGKAANEVRAAARVLRALPTRVK